MIIQVTDNNINLQRESIQNFMAVLNIFSEPDMFDVAKVVTAKFDQSMARDVNLYLNPEELKSIRSSLIDQLNYEDNNSISLIDLELCSFYSIFKFLFDDNFSDFVFSERIIILSESDNGYHIHISDHIYQIYQLFLNHLVSMIIHYNNTDLSILQSRKDLELGGYRFSLTHKSLTTHLESNLVITRKPMPLLRVDENYLQNITDNSMIQRCIHQYAQEGNAVIFGTTGSGKTTLLRYMCNYKLDDKRNLCVLEDTSELNINVPISLLVNNTNTLHDLFKSTLRFNPSSVIIGETRDDTIVDILEAALTTNVLTTIHATTLHRAFKRITSMALPRHIPREDVEDLIVTGVDMFILMQNHHIINCWLKQPHIHELDKVYKSVLSSNKEQGE